MYQFFVDQSQISENTVVILGQDVNHIKNVLRMKIGEELAVSNGEDGKQYRCTVASLGDSEVVCNLEEIVDAGMELPSKIYLFQGLPKSDKMELIIQKVVELGAYEIIPVSCKRCVMKLEPKKQDSKIKRWQAIAESAAKQSKRAIIPQIHNLMTYGEALAYAKQMDVQLIPYEHEEGIERTRKVLEAIKPGQSIAIFIGPEGGFDEAEVEKARAIGAQPVTLGKRILRTETAGFTTISWLVYLLEGKS